MVLPGATRVVLTAGHSEAPHTCVATPDRRS